MCRGLFRIPCFAIPIAFLACAGAQDLKDDLTPIVTPSDRFQYYLERTYSWQKMSSLAVDTAIDHLTGRPEWGRGMGGYSCQYASGFGRRLISNTAEFGATVLFRQDTRFRPSHQSGFVPRIKYAAIHAFLATGEDGRTEVAYARFAGIAGGALIAPAWHRHTLSGGEFFPDVASSMLDQVQNSFLTEFSPDMSKLGRRAGKKLLRTGKRIFLEP
jgi:hypothetical protein